MSDNIGQTNAEFSAEHRSDPNLPAHVTLNPDVRPGDVWAHEPTNAENSAEHRTVEEREETLQAVPRYPKAMLDAIAPLSDAEKLNYLYEVALKVGKLVESISPAQVEQVKRMQANPLMSKLFAGIIKG